MILVDTVITSRKNDKISFVCALSDKKTRDEHGCFVIEGIKLVEEAVIRGMTVRAIFVLEDYVCTSLLNIVEKCKKHLSDDCVMFLVNKSCFDKMSTEKSPQGIIAVVDRPDIHARIPFGVDHPIPQDERVLMLVSLRDPGNLGTVIRSAAAFGVERLILSSDCVDIYNSKTVRSAMGSLFCTKIDVVEDCCSTISGMISSGRRVYAAELRDNARSVFDVGVLPRDCIVIGNEGHGIPAYISEICTGSVYLPISDRAESLNAAIAASVLVWEQSRHEV